MESLPPLVLVLGSFAATLITTLAGVGLGIWRAGAKEKPEYVFGEYHRDTVHRLESALEKSDKKLEEAIRLNYRLLGLTERGIEVVARSIPP